HEPLAEGELRERLRTAVRNVPEEEKASKAMSETQAFLASRVGNAMKTAPSDVLVKKVRHDLEVMDQLRSQPELCAKFFNANGTADFSFLPPDLRLAEGESYADLVEAAAERPVIGTEYEDRELVSAMEAAYAAHGFPTDDIAKLGTREMLDAGETCRL